jgi:YYY domain-containing protein
MPLSDILAAIRWWAILMMIGAAATPLAYHLFKQLPDRGYAFVKMLGLLIVSYLFWLLGSFGFLGNNVGGMLFALLGLLVLSGWALRREGAATGFRQWLGEHKQYILITELLIALVFACWVWVRAQNPAIVATEKPMEFAFLNAVGRSPSFPPLDPWLAGFAISYYYFGYIMMSLLARLAAVPEPIAFNLGIAWLVAGTAVGAFGLVYNLIAWRSSRRSALILALVAAIALPVAGNMEIVLEVLHAGNVGSAELWQWLDVRDLAEAPDPASPPRYQTSAWWWWRSSRVIHEYHLSGRSEEGLEPIAEFPGFSFVLGDMHPHVLALPFAFLSLGLAFLWWLRGNSEEGGLDAEAWTAANWPNRFRLLLHDISWPLWLLTALILGGLSFLNTWDVLIHLFVVMGAFFLAQWNRHGWHGRLWGQTVAVGVLLAVPAILLYFPFYIGFRSQAGPPFLLPMFMRPTRLVHFLIIFGLPLWSITIFLVSLAARQRFRYWRSGLITAVSLVGGLLLLMVLLGWIVASNAEGSGRVIALAAELGLALPPRPEGVTAPGWGVAAVLILLPALLRAKVAYAGLTLFLAMLLALVVMVWVGRFSRETKEEPGKSVEALPFVLLLIGTGMLLTLGPEFVYLRDNFGVRLNTIFKFYYQAWVMFGVAALFALDYLWREFIAGAQRVAPALATAGYATALALALMFPYYAIASRAAEYRGPVTAETRQPPTLNGLAQLNLYNPDEYAAVTWLRQNVSGTPVILEAVGGQYSGYGRISASTGLPTLLGWAGHEYQWRGSSTAEPGQREPVVRQIYEQPDWANTADLLNQYQVEYIYVGGLELSTYGPQSQAKFNDRLEVAYNNNSVTIYRWQPH